MKRLLFTLLFCTSALAADSDWNIRVKYGTAGAPPFDQSATELPKRVVDSVAFAARDPYVRILSWSNPVIHQVNSTTKAWKFKVMTQYRDYTVFVDKDRATAY